jgi:hypothetical protein
MSAVSALTIYEGLEACFQTIAGIKAVILGEPTAIHDPPALYSAYGSFDRLIRNYAPATNLTGDTHIFMHRLVIRWQDNARAERELLSLITAIPDAVDADPRLGGRVAKGLAKITRGESGFITIGSTKYRVVDYTSEVLTKA